MEYVTTVLQENVVRMEPVSRALLFNLHLPDNVILLVRKHVLVLKDPVSRRALLDIVVMILMEVVSRPLIAPTDVVRMESVAALLDNVVLKEDVSRALLDNVVIKQNSRTNV